MMFSLLWWCGVFLGAATVYHGMGFVSTRVEARGRGVSGVLGGTRKPRWGDHVACPGGACVRYRRLLAVTRS